MSGPLLQWAIRWALGCVNHASRLPLAVGHEFTQPRARLLADPCNRAKGTAPELARKHLDFEPPGDQYHLCHW